MVLEASFNTWALADLLQKHAGRVVVSIPMRTKAIASAKIKTEHLTRETVRPGLGPRRLAAMVP